MVRNGARLTTALMIGIGIYIWSGAALADTALQVYGITLDGAHVGAEFCETGSSNANSAVCAESGQSLPTIQEITTGVFPLPADHLTFKATDNRAPDKLDIWYLPNGRSYLIRAYQYYKPDLGTSRQLQFLAFGPPTIEFSNADISARGLGEADASYHTLIYVDPELPKADYLRVTERLKSGLNPTGKQLHEITDTSLSDLAQLVGADFRGAIIQIIESWWGRQSTIIITLVDLPRASRVLLIPAPQ